MLTLDHVGKSPACGLACFVALASVSNSVGSLRALMIVGGHVHRIQPVHRVVNHERTSPIFLSKNTRCFLQSSKSLLLS